MPIPRHRLVNSRLVACAVWLIATCGTLVPTPLAAHAIIVSSTPAAGATVRGADVAIELRFNSRLDQARSRLTLIGPGGASTALSIAAAAKPDTLTATATGLARGAYRLRWQVLAIDGHITRGDIPFTVAP